VFLFQAADGIRDDLVTGVQTCALPICRRPHPPQDGLLRSLMLILAILLLLLGIFLTLEAIAAPKRERRALLRRASTYGKPRGVRSEERRVGKGARRGRAAVR